MLGIMNKIFFEILVKKKTFYMQSWNETLKLDKLAYYLRGIIVQK